MTVQVKLVFLLTFVIHLISMLSYAVRIAGVRTRRIAVSLAMFNVLLLVSRTSNTFNGCLPVRSGTWDHIVPSPACYYEAFRFPAFVTSGLLLVYLPEKTSRGWFGDRPPGTCSYTTHWQVQC